MKNAIIVFIFLSNSLLANYIKYYQLINKGEEVFVSTKSKTCLKYYDSAFSLYKKPFVKDIYIAAQIAFYLKDSNLFLKYINLGFKNGLPLSAVPSAPLLRQITKLPLYKTIKVNFEKNKANNIDFSVREKILKMSYEGDSIKLLMGRDTAKINKFNASENNFRDYLNSNFITKGLFPNEHIIGIATDTMYSNFLSRNHKKDMYGEINPFNIPAENLDKMEYDLVSKFSLSVLIHSKCSFPKLKKGLWDAVLNGYMHPKEYAFLHETSITWNQKSINSWDNCNPIKQQAYYNILGYSPVATEQTFVSTAEGLEQVEKNRKELYIQKYSVDTEKKKVQNETGIRFFFGFANSI